MLQFQSHTNPLSLSSLKGWVRDSAFSAHRFLIPTSKIRYIFFVYLSDLKDACLALCSLTAGPHWRILPWVREGYVLIIGNIYFFILSMMIE